MNDHQLAFYDVLPTFCDVAGIKDFPKAYQRNEKDYYDGISFFNTLTGKDDQQQKHDHLYWEFHEEGGKQAVRYKHWKGVRLNVNKDKEAPIELYDLRTDRAEQHNLAEQYPKIVKKMKKIIIKYKK